MINLPDRIKTYPDLNLAALKLRKHKQLRVWYLLRALDERGCGGAAWKEAQKALESIMRYESFRTLVLSGCGMFWDLRTRKSGEKAIVFRSLARVTLALGIKELVDRPIYVPFEAFKRLRDFKAYIYKTCFDGKRPLSRQTIERETGLSKPTQVTYGKVAKVKTTRNVCFLGPATEEPTKEQKEAGYFVTISEGSLQMCKRMPNTYSCDLPQAPRGSMRRANSQLLSCRKIWGGTIDNEQSENPRRWVRFERKPKYLPTRSYGGTQLWCMA